MKCSSVQNILSAYIDETLSLVQLLRVRQHLLRCAACRRLKAELEATKSLLRVTSTPPARPGFWDEAYRCLEANARVQSRRADARRRWRLKPILALAVIIVCAAVIPIAQRQQSDVPVHIEDMVKEHAAYSSGRPTADRARLMLFTSEIDNRSIIENSENDASD